MKIKLLRKAKRNVLLLNKEDIPAGPKDKCIKVVVIDPVAGPTTCITSKNKHYYAKYGNAWNRRCDVIVDLAIEIQVMPWWKRILY